MVFRRPVCASPPQPPVENEVWRFTVDELSRAAKQVHDRLTSRSPQRSAKQTPQRSPQLSPARGGVSSVSTSWSPRSAGGLLSTVRAQTERHFLKTPRLAVAAPAADTDWRAAVAELREQQATLVDCLAAAGALRVEDFQARLHGRRFEAAKSASPCGHNVSYGEMLSSAEVLLPTAGFAGAQTAFALTATSRSASHVLTSAGACRNLPREASLKMCVYGGNGNDRQDHPSSIEMFDSVCRTWQGVTPSTTSRSLAAAAVLNGRLYLCGGQDPQRREVGVAERLDLVTGSWETLASLHRESCRAVAVIVGSRLYICGGLRGEECLRTVQRLDPTTNSWEMLAPMLEGRFSATGAALDGQLCICGGFDGQHHFVRSTERYDPVADVWEALAPMPQQVIRAAIAVLGGRLYACGGVDASVATLSPPNTPWRARQSVRTVSRLSTVTGAWESLTPLHNQRHGAAIAVMGGRLFVCGGDSGRTVMRSAESFDPNTNEWEKLPPMLQCRFGGTAVKFGAYIYISGGFDGHSCMRSVERFDPKVGRWENVAWMTSRRSFAFVSSVLA
eukprot:TRINITY_DN25994_c0_g1_i1.p1 TRINITY_DN25994_c0_g1~~TRINITY_DN25994_c0_g1_i1.p1  ORF type:complete len:561 (+),score=89.16 TRINITY_DN25994_c0_g1_i1:203-1885(+)